MPSASVPSTPAPALPWWRRLLTGAAVVAVAVALWLTWDPEAFRAWRQEAGPLPFFTALAILPAFGVPTTPFYILAGATFGIAGGLTGSALSLAVNLLLCFWIAHSGLRQALERWLARTRFRLPAPSSGRMIRFALLVKFAPGAPTFIKTYLIAIAGVPFPIYFGLSFFVTMAYAAAFIVLGESMLERDFSRGATALALLFGLAAAVWLGQWWWRRRRGSAATGGPGDGRP